MCGKRNNLVRSVTREVLLRRPKDIMEEKNEKDVFERTRNVSLLRDVFQNQVDGKFFAKDSAW